MFANINRVHLFPLHGKKMQFGPLELRAELHDWALPHERSHLQV